MDNPKYKAGDTVWHMFVGMPIETKVKEYVGGKEKLYKCFFYLTTAHFREYQLYPTKEDLLNSM